MRGKDGCRRFQGNEGQRSAHRKRSDKSFHTWRVRFRLESGNSPIKVLLIRGRRVGGKILKQEIAWRINTVELTIKGREEVFENKRLKK